MHDDRELAERRIDRELWERVLPLVHRDRVALTVEIAPTRDMGTGLNSRDMGTGLNSRDLGTGLDSRMVGEFEPLVVGTRWGAPWTTTWFRLTGAIPAGWAGRAGCRIEAVVDLGFNRAPAGFQAEGLVVAAAVDGRLRPLQGIHPRRTNYVVDVADGSVELLIEAASNPSFPQFLPSRQGLPETASTDPIYRFTTADLVLVDVETEALMHDLDVLDGVMRSLSLDDPRRAKLRRALGLALDAVPDTAAARRVLSPHLRAVEGGQRRHRIIATGHAHIDTAWLWPIRETIRKCTRTFASAVALMDDDPSYVFSCSQAQQYAWMEERHPELFEKISAKVDNGQWIPIGGMWVEADMNLPSGESLARQIVFGQRYFEEKFGKRCNVMWIPDVFGYPAGLPQLFAAGGMKRFVTQKLSWNKQNRFPHHTFWWEGLDGTQVLTHFPPVDTYNAEVTPGEVGHSIRNFKDHAWSDVSLMPFGHGDGGGGPTREMLERAHRIAQIDPSSTLEIGSPDDFFSAVEREALHGAPVPVWRGELYFEMHRGTLTSQLRTKLGNRRCERQLVAAELWEATLGHSVADDLPSLDDSWRDVLTQQFHDILPGSSIAWVHRDAEETFARVSVDLRDRTERTLGALAPAAVCAVNPSGVAFDGVVIGHLGTEAMAPDELERDGRASDVPRPQLELLEGRPHQRLGVDEYAVSLAAPAFGIVAAEPMDVSDPVAVTERSMANQQLAVRWNSQGDLVSVIDIARRREIVPDGSVLASLELAKDQPVEYDAWDLESWTRGQGHTISSGQVTIEAEGPLVGRVRVERRFGPSTVVATYELRSGARQLDIHLDIEWHHGEHLLSMTFPLDVRSDTAACDVQFGVTHRPTHPSSPWDAAKFEVCAHRYVSLAEPSFGVAVLNNGRYGHAVFDGAISVSLARAAKYPDPDADQGNHRVSLALRPHDGDLADVRAAAELFDKPVELIVPARGSGGADPRPLIEIVDGNCRPALGVEVDAIKLADDGSGDLIVRLHEAVGDRTQINLRARTAIGAAWRCDLMETPRCGEEVGDGILTTTLRPFELVTLRLEIAREAST